MIEPPAPGEVEILIILTMLGVLLILPATYIHRKFGRAILVIGGAIMILSAVSPDFSLASSAVSIFVMWGAHVFMLTPAEAEPPPAQAPAQTPAPAHPEPPQPEHPRAAVACAGCGATARTGERCAYCARHV